MGFLVVLVEMRKVVDLLKDLEEDSQMNLNCDLIKDLIKEVAKVYTDYNCPLYYIYYELTEYKHLKSKTQKDNSF